MAISVPIPKEITEYEEKIMFGLSLRKLVCFSSAVVLGVGTYFLCTKVLGLTMDTASYIIIAEAMPLMAFGFIKKDGMTFEKYAALLIRHKIGMNKLSYENELVIDALPDLADETAERKSKYAWIFEKETGSAGTGKQLTRKERKEAWQIREAVVFAVTEKGRKRKRKEALREIKAARQEYRTIKRRAEKAAKESRRAEKHRPADKV
jgi:hypothetical protein